MKTTKIKNLLQVQTEVNLKQNELYVLTIRLLFKRYFILVSII
jgi:hypothetical protein